MNQLTGEVVELAEEVPGTRKWSAQHVRVFQVRMQQLAIQGILRTEATRVLLYLLGVLDWDNWLAIKQARIAQQLGMTPSQVSRAMRQLIKADILQQAGAGLPKAAYRLKTELAYKGSYAGWQKRRREEREKEKT